jgi:putative two-component system response regulator
MRDQEPVILIVDDDKIARETLAFLLNVLHVRVEYAETGMQGINKAYEIQPDIIILDVLLPDVMGYEVCKTLREEVLQADVPIIMITALDNRNDRIIGLAAGANDFFSKPFDSLEVQVKIRNLIRLKRYRHRE